MTTLERLWITWNNLDSERGCSLEESLSQDTRVFTVIVLIGGAIGKNWAL